MDQQINSLLERFVNEILSSPNFQNYDLPTKGNLASQIDGYLSDVIIDVLFDNLSPTQVDEANSLDFSRQESLEKLGQWALGIPNFVGLVEQRLNIEAEKIKQSGQIPQSE